MPRWVHANVLLPLAVVVALWAVLIARFGWGVLVFGALLAAFATLVGLWLARRLVRQKTK